MVFVVEAEIKSSKTHSTPLIEQCGGLMLFSSPVFLVSFLPAVLLIYYGFLRNKRNLQNIFLFLASLGFYAWGEPKFVLILIGSIIVNWYLGLEVDKYRKHRKKARRIIVLDIVFNISIIFIFKYLTFTMQNIDKVFNISIDIPNIVLPIGISFFTFQAISYVLDVYRGNGKAQKTPLNVGLYIAFFPQLIAGPIVRYNTIAQQIDGRKETFTLFSEGVCRFIIGLSKKVLLANTFASLADYSFGVSSYAPISIDMAWIGAIAYTFQIYYDFSGYSDMAIGLGKMFGFHFEENFNYPYISKSTSEFWRRWHISLGQWFKDYVYIPMGGNRGKNKVFVNLFVVWLLTGIWHGANFTFILWGMLYFVSVSLERLLGFEKIKGYHLLKHVYTLLLVTMGWVLFRSETIASAITYIGCMFRPDTLNMDYLLFVLEEHGTILLAGILCSTPLYSTLKRQSFSKHPLVKTGYVCSLCFLFLASFSFLIKGSYNPFIYFNF